MSSRYSSKIIAKAVRRSLRGRAARVAMHVDKDAPLETLISKLTCVFGDVHTEHNIMSQFYTAKQGDEESVAEWSCRLEDILSQGVTLGKVQPGQTEDLLRTTLWAGLRSQLRDLTSHKFDQGGSFEDFLRYLRQLEVNLKERNPVSKKKPDATSRATFTQDSELKEIRGILKSMSTEIAALKKQNKDAKESDSTQAKTGAARYNHGQGQSWQSGRGQQWQMPPRQWIRPQQPRENPQFGRGGQHRFQGPQTFSDILVCYRCGQPDHIRRGCRTRIDNGLLNFNRPMGRGGPLA
ncbi:uncharacterized protein LOC124133740 isoform X2 [Haliotis rufescens]|uniref:uncharacterized protein LOC124133740 isoform X2 n=1 Tax=Haliotis rufescens TaxID=6454 RepID=UPI00201ECE18|nr:uncharacterized protein LOC124133740 isoform X2 [Haliotis rufescens]